MIARGILIDKLLPDGKPVDRTRPQMRAMQAALLSKDGRIIMNILNQLVVGHSFPISKAIKAENSGALIALEAVRNFVRELELIAGHNEHGTAGNEADAGSSAGDKRTR